MAVQGTREGQAVPLSEGRNTGQVDGCVRRKGKRAEASAKVQNGDNATCFVLLK